MSSFENIDSMDRNDKKTPFLGYLREHYNLEQNFLRCYRTGYAIRHGTSHHPHYI